MAKKKCSGAGTRRPNAGSFKKGPDERRNVLGTINKGELAFKRTLKELIVAEGESLHKDAPTGMTLKKVEWMVKVVWNAALKGEPWAVQFITERTEGKVKENIEITRPDNYRVRYSDEQEAGA